MNYKETGVVILSETKNGERIVSCGGRISTRQGTAIELYRKAFDKEKNKNLISKVVASGHKTILEHHYFNLAFNNVSIFVEQFLIEFRFASFTIKSGRYVNFSSAGFNLPSVFSMGQKRDIKKHFKNLFSVYDKFVEKGIPVEDARFVLPYGLKTNIYMSVNARELCHIICTMIYGRGKNYPEIYDLGNQLKIMFDERYPNIIDACEKQYLDEDTEINKAKIQNLKDISFVTQKTELLNFPTNALTTINEYAKMLECTEFNFKKALKNDKIARLLEQFNYTFKVNNFSMIVLKHLTRHRVQSLVTPSILKMSLSNKFVMPESIASVPELKAEFEKCITENRELFNKLIKDKINPYLLIYIAPHATAMDFITTINARELLHLCNLRTCNRAQWEIRNLVTSMLIELKKVDKDMFENYGPSCFTFGVCPEGRLSCGKIREVKSKFITLE